MHKSFLSIGLGMLALACSSDAANDSSGGSEGAATGTITGAMGSSSPTTGSPGTSEADGPADSTDAADGSSSGSGSTGGSDSTGGGASSCADYLFCEDFEMGSPGEMPPGWTERGGWDQGGSRAVLSSDEKHGGSQSLKGAVGTNGQFRIEHDLAMLGDAVGHHWGRIFYKVKTPVALDGMYVHNTFVAFGRPSADNGDESRLVDTVVAPDGTHQFLFNVPDDSCCASSSYDYSYEGGWHCAEWYVEAGTETFRFFYDNTEVTDIAFTGVAGAHIESFSSIIVGWINYQSPSTPNEGWFDDLAIDDSQIGCD
jgi:hypothetical protein